MDVVALSWIGTRERVCSDALSSRVKAHLDKSIEFDMKVDRDDDDDDVCLAAGVQKRLAVVEVVLSVKKGLTPKSSRLSWFRREGVDWVEPFVAFDLRPSAFSNAIRVVLERMVPHLSDMGGDEEEEDDEDDCVPVVASSVLTTYTPVPCLATRTQYDEEEEERDVDALTY